MGALPSTRNALFNAGVSADAFSSRFRFGTEDIAIFITQGLQITGGLFTEGRTASFLSREMRANTNGGFFELPVENTITVDRRLLGFSGSIQGIQGVAGAIGLDLDEITPILDCNL